MHASSQPPATPLKSLLAERLRDTLRADIQRGRWRTRLPAERTLARDYQVSRPTLNVALRALAREGLVRTQPGHPWYIHAGSIPTRRAQRRQRVVILVRFRRFKREQVGLRMITERLPQKLHEMGYEFREIDPFKRGTRRVAATLAEFDSEHRASLYLLASVPPAVHRWFDTHAVPAFLIGARNRDITLPGVGLDAHATIRHAVQYLMRRGHRRLALLNLPTATVGALHFNEAFLAACAQAADRGVKGVVETTPSRPESMEAAVRRMFARSQPPTAVFVADLDLAIGLYTTLAILGLRIPRDVSVVASSNWHLLDCLRPQPTCYSVSYETVARRLARTIHDYLFLGARSNRFWSLVPTLREGKSVITLQRQV